MPAAAVGLDRPRRVSPRSRGYAVCVNYLRQHHAAGEVVSTIQREDISSEPEVGRLFEAADRQLGRLTALVTRRGSNVHS
jgi:hypothetical protein